jgi:hypothetical protein
MTLHRPELMKGTPVQIAPASYPMERWRGVIERRTPNGYAVTYESHGARFRSTFTAAELEKA